MTKPQQTNPEKLKAVVATDCGSTTTKAILFEHTDRGWRATFRGEAPTTVEKPVADVTIGALNAFTELEELSGRRIIGLPDAEHPFSIRDPKDSDNGIDLYVSTSSAGGGLQMVVAGVVSSMTTESAERAALGAGAIVMDSISIDDGREQHERVSRIRHLRPDIVLIAGGVEGGTIDHPLELAETILAASPRPRFGDTLRLPIIYAANSHAVEQARSLLAEKFDFHAVANLRPAMEEENLGPARDAIHEIFLNHVMSHAPGYKKLLSWSPVPVMPTPAAFGNVIYDAARRENISIVAVDIGGATTDVFSVFRGEDHSFVFNRTVSANLGMSYSIGNVLIEAGIENILRWLPFPMANSEIQDRIRNKMIRPTSIPQTREDLLLEQSVAREALRLAFIHHKRLAVGLRGVKQKRSIGDVFTQGSAESLVDMMKLDMIIGSGGVLSHAPDRASAAIMMIDAYEPLGVTRLSVDSVFMMPHLGVFASVHPQAATEILMRDCLVSLGTIIAPLGNAKKGAPLLNVELSGHAPFKLNQGEFKLIKLTTGEKIAAKLTPQSSTIDVGAGRGKFFESELHGGEVGLIFDGRGRPLSDNLSTDVNRQTHSELGLRMA